MALLAIDIPTSQPKQTRGPYWPDASLTGAPKQTDCCVPSIAVVVAQDAPGKSWHPALADVHSGTQVALPEMTAHVLV